MIACNLAYKTSILSLSSLFILTACGGGGGSDSGGNSNIGSGSNPPPAAPAVTLSGYDSQAALSSLSAMDSLLQIGFMSQNTLVLNSTSGSTGELSCSNGGLFEQVHADNDSNGEFSDGDTVTINYRECYVASLDDVADGSVVYDIELFAEDESFTANVDISDLIIDGVINLDGVIRVKYEGETSESSLIVNTVGNVPLNFNSQKVMTFSNFEIVKQDDYQTAKYRVGVSGSINDEELGATYRISQLQGFSGYLNEYPNEGELSISTSSTDVATVTANFVENSTFFNVSYGSDTYLMQWDDAIEGAMMGVSAQLPDYIVPFRSDNFAFVTVANKPSLDKFGLSDSVTLVFSRPVESVSPPYGEFAFGANEYPYVDVPASIEINGAMVIASPERALQADKNYTLVDIEVVATNGQNEYVYLSSIQTSNEIIPAITSQSKLYRFNDTPLLNAAETTNNSNGELSFQWREASNAGVVFDNPTGAETSFNVPEETTDDLSIEVVITAPSGYSVIEGMTISYVEPMSTILSFDSPQGDYIGGGQSRFFTDADGVFNVNSYEESANYLDVSFNGNDWWNLDLAAPSDEIIGVGVYEGARRYPFQSPTSPGLSFTGSGRGCNQSSGRFEIFELSYNESGEVESLAVDFEQSCELTNPTLKGQFRYNSNMPLNPQ
ncbi:hypothetical protein [Alteromonas hispanica]|uniref:SbsA Ig-like domain-containing protein n=1 Tax=Alteromonas hispanica TaxID=315421 RepID=A0A6L9MY76_9ALTE|nr:hypothetical protein [Alteromonas hispanica]NDW23097.1 hypothetical protein [Alteromonas hispanica]